MCICAGAVASSCCGKGYKAVTVLGSGCVHLSRLGLVGQLSVIPVISSDKLQVRDDKRSESLKVKVLKGLDKISVVEFLILKLRKL